MTERQRPHRGLQRIPTWAVLLAPAMILLTGLFVIPLLASLLSSFNEAAGPAVVDRTRWTLANYEKFFTTPYYVAVLFRSIGLSLTTTLICLVLGYLAAYYVAGLRGSKQSLVLLSFISPLLVSIVVRTYGWTVILGPKGVINAILVGLGVLESPILLIRNETGVVIGLVHVYLAFMILPIFAVLKGLDRSLLLAAKNLGASDRRAFLEITLPLSLPGVWAGATLVFVLSMASFVTPSLLGGTRVPVIAQVAFDQTVTFLNWPFGAAVGVIMLVVALGVVWLSRRVGRAGAA